MQRGITYVSLHFPTVILYTYRCRLASVAARKREILRRCAPQDDNDFVILSGTKWSEESRAPA